MKNWLYPLWVIIDVLVFLAAIALWITAPEFKTLNIGMTVFSVALGFLLLFSKFEEIKIFIRSSYFEKVLYHGINVILVFSILGVVNYLGNKNYKEFPITLYFILRHEGNSQIPTHALSLPRPGLGRLG